MKPPAATYLLDSYRFSWAEDEVEFLCDRINEERDGLKCELTISTSRAPYAGMLREGRFNLSSATTRTQWVNAVDQRMSGPDWYGMFEAVCTLTRRRWRDGEPVVDLANVTPRSGLPYLLLPFVVEGGASILFAEGGAGKSMLALAMATSVATGEEILPNVIPTRTGPVLYLDWEWDAETHAERLRAICEGAGIETPTNLVHYRHEMASVWEAAPTIRRRIAELGAVFVVVDSLGFARGGEPESADLTLKTFASFRTFGVPVLALDHVAKNATDKKYSFGSVYTTNAARITWRLEAVKEEGAAVTSLGLTNQKSNGRFQKPRGFEQVTETDDDDKLLAVFFRETDVRDVPGLTKSLTLRDQIKAVMKANVGAMKPADILSCLEAEGSRASLDSVRVTLNRNTRTFVRHGEGWGLLAVTA